MDTSSVVWIVIVAIAVIALIAVIAMMGKKKKKERNRQQAAELREKAAAVAPEVQRREAEAKETEANAAAARAAADRKAAEAQNLEAQAQERSSAAAERRDEHQEHLHKADKLDPDAKGTAPTTDPDGSARGASADENHTDDRDTTHSDSHNGDRATGPVTPEGERLDTDTRRVDDGSRDSGGSHRA